MEEVDKIILHSLRQIGCAIDDEVTSLKQFDTEMIVKSTVSCLELIQPGLGLPQSLPHNMAAKYRVGQMIAQACTDNGYTGDIGYQTFLYSGEADLRRVLMFLIEKLPKEQEKFVQEPTGSELLIRRIRSKIKEELNRAWLPVTCSDGSSYDFLCYTNINNTPAQAWKEFCMIDLPSYSIDKNHLVPTVINVHSRAILSEKEPQWSESDKRTSEDNNKTQLISNISKGKLKPPIAPRPKFLEKSKTKDKKDEKEEEKEEGEGEKEEEDKLKKEEEILTEEVEELVKRIEKLKLKKQQIIKDIKRDEFLLGEKREKNALEAKIVELLPEGEENMAKLRQVVEGEAQRLVSLAAQWEKHRMPLIEEYRKNIQLQSNRMNESVKKAESAKSLSEKRKELELELKNKHQILAQLQAENQRNGKEVNRSAYTRRILEIINNIEKQKTEIEKVLRDTRDIQKEINNLRGQLDRSFTVADETIFRDAKKDETSRKAYKLLATLHSDCDQLVEMVQETGAILREIRDLEDQIEKEKSKNISANLERITADLNQMKVESAQLSAQLKLKQNA